MPTVVHSSYTKSSATNLQHLKTRRPSVLELQTRPQPKLWQYQVRAQINLYYLSGL